MSGQKLLGILARSFKWLGGIVALALIALVGAMIYGLTSEAEINHVFTAEEATQCEDLPEAPDRILGVGFSGGGSRAAMFGAGGAAALQDAGLLKKVTHFSSVSGGGFTSSYLATHRRDYCTPNVQGATPDNCLQLDLEDIRSAMGQPYFWWMEWQQAIHPVRYFSPSRRIVSLQEALEAGFLGSEMSFEKMPEQPAFFYNAVSYDSAERFVFSNQPLPHPDADANLGLAPELRTISFTERQGCALSAPKDFPVALAVATSAAFPPVLGPLTIQVPVRGDYGEELFWHLGDGGVIENTGLDTLIDMALNARARNPYLTEATLISFNAGLRLQPEISVKERDPSLWSTDPGRLVDVSNLRADRYRDAYLREIAKRTGLKINIVDIDYLNSKLTAWPDECAAHANEPIEKIKDMIAEIPTDLVITPCHAALVLAGAKALVDAETREGGRLFKLR
ncbi:MAG: patatin-like phospholipase family protein [Pseudomonadota bacterium]